MFFPKSCCFSYFAFFFFFITKQKNQDSLRNANLSARIVSDKNDKNNREHDSYDELEHVTKLISVK